MLKEKRSPKFSNRNVIMTVEVTLNLPEALIEHAQMLGQVTQRNVEAVLTDTLELLWLASGTLPEHTLNPPVSNLPDAELLTLTTLKLSEAQNERLAELQTQGKTSGLSEVERYELLALLQIYQIGQLRKSEALAEAVRRGLRPSLSALT
jgi:hypothetical protein